jgi:predicted ferric reductase
MTLFCLNPVLSMRHRWLESLFGSLDRLYKLHIRNGRLSILLIVLHPILLGFGEYLSGKKFSTIWDWSSLMVLSGVVGSLVLLFLTITAVYGHIKHQNWVHIHRLFGWLIIIFFLHGILANSQLVEAPGLLPYTIIVGLLGFMAFLYRSVLYKIFVRKLRYQVSEINYLSTSIFELVLKPTGVPISFQAGQFAFVSFESPALDNEPHPFSFSNANNGPYVRFTIKALGDDTKKLQNITAGTPVFIEGPYGQFSYLHVKNRKQVWIAGGIGITPFLSMARSFSGKQQYDIRFFYGTESLDEAVFLQEFIDITRQLPENFDTKVVAKNLSGFVGIDMLKNSLQTLGKFDYLICGPPPMMRALKAQLLSEQVPDEQIHLEEFSL